MSAHIKSGFTLIELLVVISIIGILATLVAANLNAARSRARDAERKSDLRSLATSLRLYYNDVGRYPCSDGSFQIRACGVQAACASVTACTWGVSPWQVGGTTYMSNFPDDPLAVSGVHYRYTYVDDDNYTLDACLENVSDANGIAAGAWCTSGKMFEVKP